MGAGQGKIFQDSLQQLQEAEIAASNVEFWSRFWNAGLTQAEIIAIPTKTLQKIRQEHPKNYASLIVHLVAHLKKHLVINVGQNLLECLTCIRLLTRLIPVAFEGSSADSFEELLFWKNTIPTGMESQGVAPVDQPAVAVDTEAAQAATTANVDVTFESVLKNPRPIAVQLIDALWAYLFLSGFTCVGFKESKDEKAIMEEMPMKYSWAPGVGVQTIEPYNNTGQLDSNRQEVLSCILSTMSYNVYLTPSQLESAGHRNKWIEQMVGRKKPINRALLYSLINVALRYDPIGWGLPYNHVVYRDVPEQLMNASLHVLCALLDYQPVPLDPADPQSARPNLFVSLLAQIDQPADYEFMFKGLTKLLGNPIYATSTYLPNSTKSVSCQQELLIFFWQLIQSNKKFLASILLRDDFVDIIHPILHYMHEARKDQAQLGVVHMITFMLLYLSGEREFAIQLNRPFNKYLSMDIPKFTGNYADLLILVVIKLFIDGHRKLESLWECHLTVLANVSPYLKTLSMVASLRILKLFGSLSRRRFLFFKDKNHRYVFFLLEMFNNILQYQYEGNTFMVYAIISNKALFQALADLVKTSLADGVEAAVNATTQPIDAPAAAAAAPASVPATPVKQSSTVHQVASGEQQFAITDEWLRSWAPKMPLGTILRFLSGILPQLESILDGSAADQDKIVAFLKKTTLVGILPVPHPILIRHYNANRQTLLWFTHYMWGVLVMRRWSAPDGGLFAGTQPQLFQVRSANAPAPAAAQPTPDPGNQSVPALVPAAATNAPASQ